MLHLAWRCANKGLAPGHHSSPRQDRLRGAYAVEHSERQHSRTRETDLLPPPKRVCSGGARPGVPGAGRGRGKAGAAATAAPKKIMGGSSEWLAHSAVVAACK